MLQYLSSTLKSLPALLGFLYCLQIWLMDTLDKIIFRDATPKIVVIESQSNLNKIVSHFYDEDYQCSNSDISDDWKTKKETDG